MHNCRVLDKSTNGCHGQTLSEMQDTELDCTSAVKTFIAWQTMNAHDPIRARDALPTQKTSRIHPRREQHCYVIRHYLYCILLPLT